MVLNALAVVAAERAARQVQEEVHSARAAGLRVLLVASALAAQSAGRAAPQEQEEVHSSREAEHRVWVRVVQAELFSSRAHLELPARELRDVLGRAQCDLAARFRARAEQW